MKFGLVLISFVSLSAFAEEGKFEEHKQHAMQAMDQRISALQSAKSCVSSATNPEGMKKCHEQLKEEREKHRGEMIDARIQHLQERKAKLDKK